MIMVVMWDLTCSFDNNLTTLISQIIRSICSMAAKCKELTGILCNATVLCFIYVAIYDIKTPLYVFVNLCSVSVCVMV